MSGAAFRFRAWHRHLLIRCLLLLSRLRQAARYGLLLWVKDALKWATSISSTVNIACLPLVRDTAEDHLGGNRSEYRVRLRLRSFVWINIFAA
ncbi:MAG: hypothetical protein WCK65_11325 [Rhodospirillaceae bacterium]